MASMLYIPSALPWLSRLTAIFQLADAVLVGFDRVEQTSRAQRDVIPECRQFRHVIRENLPECRQFPYVIRENLPECRQLPHVTGEKFHALSKSFVSLG
jgi:hypothetical protein